MNKNQPFKNRCIAKTHSKKSRRCAGKITKKDNPENLSYCRVHLSKNKVDKVDNLDNIEKVDNLDNIEKVDNSDNVEKVDNSDNVEVGQCFICREECNRSSQACGSCSRKLSMYGPFALRIFRD